MAIDIRATVTCSLGTLISGSISDDYLQGSGLVKTKGSVEISGTITPAIGTVVTFSYVKGGVTRSVPRKLRVMSSFADPFRRTTKVELGCKLTYLSDLKDRVKWDAFDDPENDEATEADAAIVTLPISATSIAAECLSNLGISASGLVLTNKFSIPEFDFSAGYVQILSDLLVSESYFGYLDTNEVLQVRNLAVDAGTGPVFTSADIVDLAPIGVGQLPGEAVTVSYSTLQLAPNEACEPADEEEEEENAKLNWELEETIGAPTFVNIQYLFSDDPEPRTRRFNYIPRTTVLTEYDSWDRVAKRTTTTYTIGAALNTQYYKDTALKGNEPFGYDWAVSQQEIVEIEIPKYAQNAPFLANKDKPEDYDEVTSSRTQKTEPKMGVLGAAGISTLVEFSGGSYNLGYVSGNSVTEIIQSNYETGIKSVISAGQTGSVPVTKRSTNKSLAYAFTQQGQQDFSERVNSSGSNNYNSMLDDALVLVDDGTETITNTGREVALQSRPSQADRTNAALNKDGDPSNGWRTESSSELELAVGSAAAQRRIEFSLPYAPDDRFIKASSDPLCYTSFASDAPAKANRYGRVQNRLLLGNRNGINLQLSPERLPAAPFEPLYVQANGLTAQYRANGTSWAFDSNGIVASVDALFWAAVGGTGTFWFPVAPGITTLPTTPAIVDTSPTEVIGTIATVGATPQTALNAAFPAATSGDGVQDQATGDFWVYNGSTWNDVGTAPGATTTATTVVLPYNETAIYNGILRTRLDITKFDYSLTLLTVVPSITIKIEADVRRILKVEPPAGAVTLVAQTPMVSSGGSAKVPVIATAVAGIAPAVSGGGSVTAPAGAVTLAGIVPEIQGMQSTDVIVPVAELAVASVTPTVVSGVSIAPPSASITLAALVPLSVGFADDGFFGSYVAQVFGWDAGIQPDWWAD